MFNPVTWFNEWITHPIRKDICVGQRLAELIVVNGGSLDIRMVGKVVKAENPAGRIGLTLEESLELSYYKGCLEIFQSVVPKNVIGMAIKRFFDQMNGSNILIPTAEEKVELLKPFEFESLKKPLRFDPK